MSTQPAATQQPAQPPKESKESKELKELKDVNTMKLAIEAPDFSGYLKKKGGKIKAYRSS